VASDPVISRLVAALAADAPRALKAIRAARTAARERAWELAGQAAPGADGTLIPGGTAGLARDREDTGRRTLITNANLTQSASSRTSKPGCSSAAAPLRSEQPSTSTCCAPAATS